MSNQPSAKAFLLKIVLWLPLAFLGWYLCAPVLIAPVAALAHTLLTTFFAHAIEAVEQHGHLLDVVTRFDPAPSAGISIPDDQDAQVFFSINGLKYGYGLPLLAAMVLATPYALLHKLKYFGLGALILMLVQVWGVCFESLVTLVFKLGPDISERMHTTAFSRELLVLGYQLGYLILPAVTPLIFWMASHRAFVSELAQRLETTPAKTPETAKMPALRQSQRRKKRNRKTRTAR